MNKAKIVSFAEKKARSLSQRGEEWIAAVRRAPVWIDPEGSAPQRPWAVIVAAPALTQIRGMDLLDEPPDPETVLAKIVKAMGRPVPGTPGKYRPNRVAVEDQDLLLFLKPRLKALGIGTSCVGHLSEIDDLLLDLDESMNERVPLAGLLASEDATEVMVGAFYSAAARFHQAAPWRYLCDADVFEVRFPPQNPQWFASVLGAGGEVFGLALYPSMADLERLWESAGGPEAVDLMRSVAVWYSEETEVPFADLDTLEGKGWPIAAGDAYPVAVRMDPDDGQDRPTGEELILLSAALEAIAQFALERCIEGQCPVAETATIHIGGGREVQLRLTPADAEDLHGAEPGNPQVEDFIDGWHWDKSSHGFAREAGGFLLSFLLHHLAPMNLSEATWVRHEENTWHMGRFATRAAEDGRPFSPKTFQGPPKFEDVFQLAVSPAETRLKSYRATWNHLQRYLGSLRETSLL